jgi:hypothetical protein
MLRRRKAWQAYKTHLNDRSQPVTWDDTRDNLLARLLFEMGKVLGFNIPAIEIYKGGYAPDGWRVRDDRSTGALEYLYQLSQGKNSIPMNVVGFPVDKATAAVQAEYLELMARNLRDGKPWPVEIVGKSEDEAKSAGTGFITLGSDVFLSFKGRFSGQKQGANGIRPRSGQYVGPRIRTISLCRPQLLETVDRPWTDALFRKHSTV